MEQTQLQKKKIPAPVKSYKYFSVKAQEVIEAAGVKKLAFFYVGKNTQTIQQLIHLFDSGYTAITTANAKSMLKRLFSNTGSTVTPDFIIAEAGVGMDELKEFHRFIAEQPALASVPFMVDATGIKEEQVTRLRKMEFVDEIVYAKDYSKQQLVRRVNFLKKVKHRLTDELANRSLELSVQKAPGMLSLLKRSFDILIALTLLVLLSPVFLLVIVAMKLESKGPVFYISKRAGRGYKVFDFYKFRTMLVGADEKISEFTHMNQYKPTGKSPVFIKIKNDPRITKMGLLLRKTSLDELPQLLNVLLGDMSLVGNRPLPLEEAATLTTDEWAPRFMAPAGMTGLWQIKKRGKKTMSIEERVKLDINYAANYNFFYDLWIMANTPSALFQRINA
jgi:lipopolysaccharide/colanic/teichoic acid biosynthesis glycosyltransferase